MQRFLEHSKRHCISREALLQTNRTLHVAYRNHFRQYQLYKLKQI